MGQHLAWWTFAITVLSACILVVFERLVPYTKGQRVFREGFFSDFFWYSIVQNYLLGLAIYGFASWVADVTSIAQFGVIRTLPLWVQTVLFLVVHDLYIYWFHRWQHSSPILWRIHEAHHSTHEVDWLSGSRSHVLEILINQTVEYLPILLLASPEIALIKGSIDAIWGMYIHSNIGVRSGRLQRFINGPEMHRWHHAANDEAHNRNFSTKLAVWDWLFGTAYLPDNRKPSEYGIGEDFPQNYFAQHVYAFRRTDSEGD